MTDPIEDLIGDYRAFTALQRDRLAARGIDIAPYELSHLAVRVPEWDQYVHLRTLLERHAVANRENVWNGRPISLIVLTEPLEVLDGKVVPLIELIPPVHQRVYKMGLEHLGVVVGEEVGAAHHGGRSHLPQHRAGLFDGGLGAADLIAQAEHDPDARAIFITWNRLFASRVANAVKQRSANSYPPPDDESAATGIGRSVRDPLRRRGRASSIDNCSRAHRRRCSA